MTAVPGSWLPGAALATTTEFNAIPEMIHPMGKHWTQPKDIRSAQMDEVYVRLTEKQVAQLPVYDSSYPSGCYDGKCWLRHGEGHVQWLCWYHPHAEPGKIGIDHRVIIVE